eukprot:m.62086 g.62086  ORF g.62086 m.62086 type:complete len:134 (-) comp23082_c0_seq1:389-790(-)
MATSLAVSLRRIVLIASFVIEGVACINFLNGLPTQSVFYEDIESQPVSQAVRQMLATTFGSISVLSLGSLIFGSSTTEIITLAGFHLVSAITFERVELPGTVLHLSLAVGLLLAHYLELVEQEKEDLEKEKTQ